MALARHRDYRTTQRYVRLDGAHLRHAVAHLVETPTHREEEQLVVGSPDDGTGTLTGTAPTHYV